MKIFFDTNVYVAEALVGHGAIRMLEATRRGKWRVYSSSYQVAELVRVLLEDLHVPLRSVKLIQQRILARSTVVKSESSAEVPDDPKDSPILQAALTCGADYLVTNDQHLLDLNPFEGLGIISMNAYHDLLEDEGLIRLP
jgi:putative PIN family toxin of toxin-antitoxin system